MKNNLLAFSFLKYLILLVGTIASFHSYGRASIEFNYCYETREFLPHFAGNSLSVPEKDPGATIEILQELDARLDGLVINFKRYAWLRCLKELRTGKVSGVIGSYTMERAEFGQFPAKGEVTDTDRAFSRISTCLVQHQTENIGWNGKEFSFQDAPSIAIPRGYRTADKLKEQGFDVYEVDTSAKAHALLKSHRVAASISSCAFDELPDSIVQNPIPIRVHYGYFIISKVFYEEHKALAEKMWDTLVLIDKQKYYQKYAITE